MNNTVTTRQGDIAGASEGGVQVFRGIPYAAPPTGANRWLPPQPHPAWDGVRDASGFGAEAPQNPSALDSMLGTTGEPPTRHEDCLFLNVWTPAADTSKRPVMFWIHGGGFTIGSGSGAVYDGQYLAREGDVVVVTINYRMGALGFMNLAALTDGKIPATGNEGLLDQIAALEWVRDNIAAFGGDPGNVTIFGESAGGMSCGALLAMPGATGLFHKAIPQSGACHTAITMEQARAVAETTLELLGVDAGDADALMALPETDLTAVQAKVAEVAAARGLPGMSYQPVIDGIVLPARPIERVRGGSAAGVAILTGSTANEWNLFSGMAPSAEIGEVDLAAQTERMFEGGGAAGVAGYRKQLGNEATAGELSNAMMTDRVFRMPAIYLLEAQAQHDERVFAYRFDWQSPLMGGALGACHAVELGFVFGTYDKNGGENFFGKGEAADAVSDFTRAAWINFARTGSPAGGLVPDWPVYGESRATMIIGTNTRVESAPDEGTRQMWREGSVGAL
ncbi:MAG: carboxylesterase [Gammaproteobacteria bacterium]|nr:carboxylesterase [Gammaproteobacteria bacterium]